METNVHIILQLYICNSLPISVAIDIPNLYLGIHLFLYLSEFQVHLACIFETNCADVN